MSADPPASAAPADDGRQAAVRRLAASRHRLTAELMPPTPAAGRGHAASWLRRPLRTLIRWWRRHQPLDLLQDWLAARPTPSDARQGPASNAVGAAFHELGRLARRQPAGAVALALGLGGLAYLLRRPLWRAGAAVAGMASQRLRVWVLTVATDPAIYRTLIAAWLTQRAASSAPDAAEGEPDAGAAE